MRGKGPYNGSILWFRVRIRIWWYWWCDITSIDTSPSESHLNLTFCLPDLGAIRRKCPWSSLFPWHTFSITGLYRLLPPKYTLNVTMEFILIITFCMHHVLLRYSPPGMPYKWLWIVLKISRIFPKFSKTVAKKAKSRIEQNPSIIESQNLSA